MESIHNPYSILYPTNVYDILYIEDDEVDIQNAQREFTRVNKLLNIVIAHDGIEALNKLYGRNGEEKLPFIPELILLDINMPKMNGIKFLEALRADSAFDNIRIYILTGSYDTKTKLVMNELNVKGCIVKPLQYEDALKVFWTLLH